MRDPRETRRKKNLASKVDRIFNRFDFSSLYGCIRFPGLTAFLQVICLILVILSKFHSFLNFVIKQELGTLRHDSFFQY